MTTHSDMLFHLGGLPVMLGLPFSKNSHYFFVDPANGSSSGSGTFDDPCDSIVTAEDLTVANRHDTVIYIAGSSGDTWSEALTWDKNYTHLVGICAPTHMAQRARIFQLATLTAASPLFTISATGCIFKNFYIFQGVDDATSLINVSVTGGRNYFGNVHFAGGGHATQAIDGGASLLLNGAEENLFERCTVGVDTIAAATGMAGMLLDGAAVRNEFVDSKFIMYAGHAGAKFVEVVDNAGFDRFVLFRNTHFINDASAYTMTEAFTVPSGMGSATHRILLDANCTILGVGDVEDNDRGIVYLAGGAITAGGNAGIAQVSATT